MKRRNKIKKSVFEEEEGSKIKSKIGRRRMLMILGGKKKTTAPHHNRD